MDLAALEAIKEAYLSFIQALKDAPSRLARDLGYTAIPEMKKKWLAAWTALYNQIEGAELLALERVRLDNLILEYEKKFEAEIIEENKALISQTIDALNALRKNNY